MIPDRFGVLPEIQRRLVPVLGPVARECGYYLAGGTAIALYMGHRESIDFDFFSARPSLAGSSLRDHLLKLGIALDTASFDMGTLLGTVDNVKVSFFVYQYDLIAPAHQFADPAMDVAAISDLCAMKLSAVMQRGSRKDFIDIHRLILAGTPLSTMLDFYKKKYPSPAIFPVLRSLTYFDDAENEPMPRMLIPTDWQQIKRDIASAVREITQRPGA